MGLVVEGSVEPRSNKLSIVRVSIAVVVVALVIVGVREFRVTDGCPDFAANAKRIEREEIWRQLSGLKPTGSFRECEVGVGRLSRFYRSAQGSDQIAASTITELETAGWAVDRQVRSGTLLVCAHRRLFDDMSGEFTLYESATSPNPKYEATVRWSTKALICP
jgi:hypothetical protein